MTGTSSFIQWYQVYISVCFTASVFNHNKVNVFYKDLLPPQDVWKFPLVFYRTSALWGHCPALTPLLHWIALSARHRLPLTMCDPWMTSQLLAKRLIIGHVHWLGATLGEPISLRGSVDWLEGCATFPAHPHNSPQPPTKLPLPTRVTASKRFCIGYVSVFVMSCVDVQHVHVFNPCPCPFVKKTGTLVARSLGLLFGSELRIAIDRKSR